MEADQRTDDDSDDPGIRRFTGANNPDPTILQNDEFIPAGLRATHLGCTVNFQRSANVLSVDDVGDYVNTVLLSQDNMSFLLGMPEDSLIEVRVLAPAIEIGTERRLVHSHFKLEILHTGNMTLAGMQKRWQNFIKMTVPFFTNGVYVNIVLDESSRVANYILKYQ
jgi:hypothetical protein